MVDTARVEHPRYSFMSNETANGLEQGTRQRFDQQEKALRQKREAIQASEASLASNTFNGGDYARIVETVNIQRNDPINGLTARENNLRSDQTAATRAVKAVGEMAQKMGVEPPPVQIVFTAEIVADTVDLDNKRAVVFSRTAIDLLNEKELAFVAAHEVSRATQQRLNGHEGEFKTDGDAIQATNDMASAASALRKFALTMGGTTSVPSSTHPSVDERIARMQDSPDKFRRKLASTPPQECQHVRR